MNVPAGAAPTTPVIGDLYLITGGDGHLQFVDPSTTPQSLAFLADVTASNTSVAAETARATAAEGAELTRATAAEGVLTASVSTEVTRATGAEATLGTTINGEIARATGAEATLTTNLAGEVSRATAQELLKANLDGGNLFTNGKQTLAASVAAAASLNVPAGAAPTTPVIGDLYLITGGDGHLQFVDPSTTPQSLAFLADVTASNTSVAAETARATAAEGAELTRATAAEGVLTASVSTEVTRATGAEATLGTTINGEIARATGAEATLTTNLAGEVSRATAQELLKANLDGGNLFTNGKQTLAASATGAASLNVPAGAAPTTPSDRRLVFDHGWRRALAVRGSEQQPTSVGVLGRCDGFEHVGSNGDGTSDSGRRSRSHTSDGSGRRADGERKRQK